MLIGLVGAIIGAITVVLFELSGTGKTVLWISWVVGMIGIAKHNWNKQRT